MVRPLESSQLQKLNLHILCDPPIAVLDTIYTAKEMCTYVHQKGTIVPALFIANTGNNLNVHRQTRVM